MSTRFDGDVYATDLIYDVLMDISPTFNDTVINCKWHDSRKCGCRDYIVPVFTTEGVCFAFNALNSHDIYTEEYVKSFNF